MVFLLNRCENNSNSKSWGLTAIYTTDDTFYDPSVNSISELTKCSGDFFDGGFKNLGPCKGRYLIIARTGPGIT